MADLKLKMACKVYDRTLPFYLGWVKPRGIELELVDVSEGVAKAPGVPAGHTSHMHAGLVDMSEHSAAVYLVMKEMGCDFTAVPVFPHRRFRHAYIYVHKQAGITGPKDLEGRRVGVPRLANTAALWARGALMHAYGVDYDRVQWVPFSAEYAEGMEKPKDMNLAEVVTNKSEVQALKDREIDAYIFARHNYHILHALCQYGYEQRLVETRFKPEDIWITGPLD